MNKDIVYFALECALKKGAQGARISYGESIEGTISTLNSEIDNIRNATSRSISLSLYVDGRFATFSTNKLTPEELERFITECIYSCRLLGKDPFRALPDPGRYFKGNGNSILPSDPNFEQYTFDQKFQKLQGIYDEIPKDKRIISIANEYSETWRYDMIIDSQGLEAYETHTSYILGSECTAKDSGDIRPQNGWGNGDILFENLSGGAGLKAYNRTVEMIGARKINSGRYNVVFDNSVSAKGVSAIISAVSGSSIKEKNSFLLDTIGKKIFPEKLTIADDPHSPLSSGATCFDGEGVATKYSEIIKDGYVNMYLLNTYLSNKLNMAPTISSPNSIILPKNDGISTEQIMKNIGKGILITGFNGGNSNPVTGDFSYGIEGFYFEDGIKLYPIKESNITGNFISLWANNIFIGNDPIKFYKWQIPGLAFADIDISGL